MKRVVAVLVACLMGVALMAATPLAAQAKAKKHHRDTPGCVTQAEYRAARGGMTQLAVRNIFDTWGRVRFNNDHGYYEGQWVDDGYWVSDGYWEDDGYFDDFGNWIPNEQWIDTTYWEDTSYYDSYSNWVPVVDIVRSYKKCRTFNHGRGRVGINFDNYSRTWLSGPRVAYKNPSDPSFMDVAAYFRKGARLAGKVVPTAHARLAKPAPKPTSAKPAPKPVGPKPVSSPNN